MVKMPDLGQLVCIWGFRNKEGIVVQPRSPCPTPLSLLGCTSSEQSCPPSQDPLAQLGRSSADIPGQSPVSQPPPQRASQQPTGRTAAQDPPPQLLSPAPPSGKWMKDEEMEQLRLGVRPKGGQFSPPQGNTALLRKPQSPWHALSPALEAASPLLAWGCSLLTHPLSLPPYLWALLMRACPRAESPTTNRPPLPPQSECSPRLHSANSHLPGRLCPRHTGAWGATPAASAQGGGRGTVC